MKMNKKTIVLNKNLNNRIFGIRKTDFTKQQLEILKEFTQYIKHNNIKSDVKVTIRGFDKYKIINRINIYIENKKFNLIFRNIYCGGMYGSDRIFQVLYSFEYLLSDLINSEFEHYKNYSLSNDYKLL